MKKRVIASVMALMTAAMLLSGCGSASTGTGQGEQAQEETAQEGAEDTQEAATAETAETAEAAEEVQTERPDDAYLSGIKVADYVELAPDYASMTVEVAGPAEVTDEDVNNEITAVLEANQELREIEGRTTVQEGDIANIDYTGYLNGEAFDGGSAEGFDLEIGSGRFIDGFEDGLIGKEVGEEVELTLTFPENYSAAELAGQETVFQVKINSIQEYVIPDFTDEFIEKLGIRDDFGNLITTAADYRTYVKNSKISENEANYTSEVRNTILDQIVEKSTFSKDLPEALVDRFYDQIYDEIALMAQMYGTDIRTMVSFYGMDPDNYEQQILEVAQMNAETYLALYAVAEKENLLLSDEDFSTELEKYVQNSESYSSVDEMDREFKESYREYLNANNALTFLVSKTTVIEPAAEAAAAQ